MQADNHNLIWIDLEMTGLDTVRDSIIEIATIITDTELNILAEGPVLAIHQSDEVLNGMDDWNQKHHGASGLLDRVRSSKHDEAQAEAMTLDFLRQYVPEGKSPMCGNSICQDRRFMARCMPRLERYFSYRHIDVSTVKELCKRWYPGVASTFTKAGTHQALEDIRESIEELRHYRQHIFLGQ